MWIQLWLSFALWIGYGVVQLRRSRILYDRMSVMTRQRRTVIGTVLLIGSGALLLAGLYVLDRFGAFQKGGIAPWGWLTVTGLGLAFVHAQTISAAMLVSLANVFVTKDDERTSR